MRHKVKRFIAILTLISFVFFSCAAPRKISLSDDSGRTVEKKITPYGILNSDEKNQKVQYQLSVGDIFLSILLVETIVVPIICIGFYLWEPVDAK